MRGESNMETYTTIWKIVVKWSVLCGSGNSDRGSAPTWRGGRREGVPKGGHT